MTRHLVFIAASFTTVLLAPCAHAWGGPHGPITRAALDALPAWQQEAFGAERQPLASLYCALPDLVYSRADLAPYAMMDSRPGVKYLVGLHLPASPTDNYALLSDFLERAVDALRTNNVAGAARYAGTLVHMLQDWSCPAHVVPDDNMFTLFKQFLPPPERYAHVPLHSLVENGTFTVVIDGYRPSLTGTSVPEAAFILLRRSQECTRFARGQVVPILNALYAGETNAWNAAQQTAACFGARLAADALYTLICLARNRFEPDEVRALQSIDLTRYAPLEAPDLYLPQAAFFSRPYWGYATVGASLRDGKTAVPLALRVSEAGRDTVKVYEHGEGVGTRSVLTYLIPADVYARFQVSAGLHAELGEGGHVRFEILGNGKRLADLPPIRGTRPAYTLDLPLAGITNLQLIATSAGGDGSGNHAVWGAPRLLKDRVSHQERVE